MFIKRLLIKRKTLESNIKIQKERELSMKVYIVRHGETLYNALNQYSDEKIDLNENGILQAKELREEIKEINYDVIIASPLLRTRHTSQIINVHKKEIIIDERIKEREIVWTSLGASHNVTMFQITGTSESQLETIKALRAWAAPRITTGQVSTTDIKEESNDL